MCATSTGLRARPCWIIQQCGRNRKLLAANRMSSEAECFARYNICKIWYLEIAFFCLHKTLRFTTTPSV